MTEPDDTQLESEIRRMIRIGSCRSPSFSPDTSEVAFVSDLNGIPQIWRLATEGGWPKLVTTLIDPISSVKWSPDGSWLAFTSDPGGGMNTQVYIIHPDGTSLRRLTAGGKETNRLYCWSTNSEKLAIGTNIRNPSSIDAYLLDISTEKCTLIAKNLGPRPVTDISRDGKKAILNRLVNRGDNDLYLLDLDSKSEYLLTPHIPPSSFGGGVFSPDGNAVYLSSNKDRELSAFAKISLSREEPGPIQIIAEREDAELSDLRLSLDGKWAALTWNRAGMSELDLMELADGTSSRLEDFPAGVIAMTEFSKEGSLLAVEASSSASPWDIWLVDTSTRQFWKLTHSPHPGIVLEKLVRPELVHFEAHDGLQLTGWMYTPEGYARPGPMVLSFHGGPESQERPMFNSTYQALLRQGIAVFAPNIRGSSGFGKTFVNLDNGPLRTNGVRDIEACANHIVRDGIADPARIGIMGGSYGGYMTMAGLAWYPEHFAAGANLYGVVNFETFFTHTEPWMASISKTEYGDPDTQKDMLRDLSPIHKVSLVKAPTLVLHGANDTNVPVVEAEQVVQSLRERGIPHDYVLFPDEGHGFRKTENRIKATTAIVKWFTKYLKT